MRSRQTYELGRPRSGSNIAKPEPARCWPSSTTGSMGHAHAGSELAKAARYSLARWQALTRYMDDGRIEIDNSAAERALRGVAVGRGNYLFMGSNDGGERAAALHSLVKTAKLNELDPEAYPRRCSRASPSIRSTASRNCCPGTCGQTQCCRGWQREHPGRRPTVAGGAVPSTVDAAHLDATHLMRPL